MKQGCRCALHTGLAAPHESSSPRRSSTSEGRSFARATVGSVGIVNSIGGRGPCGRNWRIAVGSTPQPECAQMHGKRSCVLKDGTLSAIHVVSTQVFCSTAIWTVRRSHRQRLRPTEFSASGCLLPATTGSSQRAAFNFDSCFRFGGAELCKCPKNGASP
jgi:hypothetical protein